jgi:hypothetical protein
LPLMEPVSTWARELRLSTQTAMVNAKSSVKSLEPGIRVMTALLTLLGHAALRPSNLGYESDSDPRN